MNIVFDYNVDLTSEYRSALSPILPKGLAPLLLDPIAGLRGTPDRKEGFVFVTSLPSDILNYHEKFFEKYKDAPQWFVILIHKSDQGIMRLNEAGTRYGLYNFKSYFVSDLDHFVKAVDQIASEKKKVPGKILICAKHKNTDLEKLGRFLFGEDTSRFDVQILAEALETDASILFLCGERQNDFRNLKILEGMEPYFIVLKPEMHIQQYLRPDDLICFLASQFCMTAERVMKRIFFVSLQYEMMKQKISVRDAIQDQELFIWDSFGLPLPRKDYTTKAANDFLKKYYTDGSRLKVLFADR